MYWFVWDPETSNESDARSFSAHSAEAAVEIWAEREDRCSAEYSIARGREAPTVCVRANQSEAPTQRFTVTGEAVPSYRARKVT